jgi:peptidoglycan/xylan/chitin deacetylase (PgdA/CDA1 family)
MRAAQIRPDVSALRRSYWEATFATVDPWNYGSDYEQIKYERTLAFVPPGIERALELACAEGHFTLRLAGRVRHLTATDISQTALARAQARCASIANIVFRKLDFIADTLPTGFDLIVCSEALYYLEDRDQLAALCGRLAAAVVPGGRLLCAHAFVLKDDLSRTAFDWDNQYGAAVITEIMARTPGLALEARCESDLYRIDLFRHLDQNQARPLPRIEYVPIGSALQPEVARQIVWGGAEIRRADVYRSERTERVPVLMYHRVAEDGPPALARYRTHPDIFQAQMRWLRTHGYHAISPAELTQGLFRREPFPGRPVVITFDDGTNDFFGTAWPILRECDLSAEVFIVTDLVGCEASWDAEYGQAAPLMDVRMIEELARAGVQFGSHLATHRPADGLASAELVAELARSRSMLEIVTRRPVTALAAPHGICDDRLISLAQQCGYEAIFTANNGFAQLGSNPFFLPRIEVRGDWNLDGFSACLESAR